VPPVSATSSDDQHGLLGQVDLARYGRQDDRHREPLLDVGVELDVHHVEVL